MSSPVSSLAGKNTFAGGGIYFRLGRSVDEAYAALSAEDLRLFEVVSDLLDGFKEQKLNTARARALREAFNMESAALAATLEAAAGPDGRYPGAGSGALTGIARQWAAISS